MEKLTFPSEEKVLSFAEELGLPKILFGDKIDAFKVIKNQPEFDFVRQALVTRPSACTGQCARGWSGKFPGRH